MVKYQQKVLVRLQTFNIYKNSGIIMTASGYNIYFYYFHRVENSMKTKIQIVFLSYNINIA